MTDLILQFGLSNACFSLALAVLAFAVSRYAKRPHLAHMLWLLVFVKLVTPPVMSIPVPVMPATNEAPLAVKSVPETTFVAPGFMEWGNPAAMPVSVSTPESAAGSAKDPAPSVSWTGTLLAWLPYIWLLGALAVLAWSLVRVVRFNRLLMADAGIAPQGVQAAAKKIADQLNLKRIPAIHTTSARISPMVWWIGGKVRVILPAILLEQMESRQWKLVLAHELAHVKRKDHLVRWIEWFACVSFWWNPVAWWAQRNLRAMEEICCDALVISSMQTRPQSYANSLLKAVEYLASPAHRPPAMASELNSGETLERRFRMIVSNRANRSRSRILQAFVMVLGLIVLPLGVASAQDYDAVSKRLTDSVKNGEITKKQAHAMMGALKKTAAGDQKAVGARLRAAVKAGELTAEQAKAMMGALEKSGASAGKKKGKGKRSGKKDGDGRKKKYAAIEKEIYAAVRAGKLSREDAGKKLAALKKKMFGDHDKKGGDKKDGDHDRKKTRDLREKYAAIEKEIIAAIHAGKLTREEAGKELAALKKKMFGDHEKKGRDKKREGTDWDALKKRVEGAVKSGELTREEAEGVYKIEKGVEDGEITRKQADSIYWIEGAVKEGKMTRKQANERYRAMFGEKDGEKSDSRRDDDEGKKRRYYAADRKIKKAIAEGKISAEDGRKRMEAMRKALWPDKREKDGEKSRSREDEGKKRRYYAAEREVKKAIAEGKLSAEDGRKRMEGVRRSLWPDKREENRDEDKGNRDAYIRRVRERLRMGVESGKMTREEAGKKMRELMEKFDKKNREE